MFVVVPLLFKPVNYFDLLLLSRLGVGFCPIFRIVRYFPLERQTRVYGGGRAIDRIPDGDGVGGGGEEERAPDGD